MDHAVYEDLGALSAEELAELVSDHGHSRDIDDDEMLSFAEPAPSVVKRTALGDRIVAVATALLKKPVREDAGVNQDHDGLIRSFFLAGVPWKEKYWDDWANNHPGPKKPEWCAAFACYCVRKGYGDAGIAAKLPAALSASTSGLRDLFNKLGRFIHRDDLFDGSGQIKPGAPLPGPGDIVLWQGHTGLLFDLAADGSYQTIEGNTHVGKDAMDGVYLCSNSSTRKIEKDGKQVYSLTGFCQLASHES